MPPYRHALEFPWHTPSFIIWISSWFGRYVVIFSGVPAACLQTLVNCEIAPVIECRSRTCSCPRAGNLYRFWSIGNHFRQYHALEFSALAKTRLP